MSCYALLLFLSPIILFLLKFYYDRDSDENKALLLGLKIAILQFLIGAFVMISPLISVNNISFITEYTYLSLFLYRKA